jgi:DNA-binding transcriptional LysR family regulator
VLNPDSLQVFVVAAETENFSLTAQRLHMSQPAVSQHISALEKRLGVLLFERRGRRIKLSATGKTLLPLVQDLLRAHKRVEEVALALSGEVVGHLVIGCSTTSGKYVLPWLLARYRERHPLVRGTIRVGLRPQVIDWLLSGEVDLGITSERVQRSGLHYCRFFEDEIVLVVPTGHPWAQRESVHPLELYEERFIMREPTSGTHMALVEGLDQVGVDVDRLETVLVVGNSEAILLAVEEGIGLGFVPRVAAKRCTALGRVKIVPLEGLSMTRWLYIAYNLALPQTPAQRAFWEFMQEIHPGLPRTIPEHDLRKMVPQARSNRGIAREKASEP